MNIIEHLFILTVIYHGLSNTSEATGRLKSITAVRTIHSFESSVMLSCVKYLPIKESASIIVEGNTSLDLQVLKIISDLAAISIFRLSEYQDTVKALNSFGAFFYSSKTKVIVIILQNLNALRTIIKTGRKYNSWNSTVMFVIIYTRYVIKIETVTEAVFKITWSEKVLNIVLFLETKCLKVRSVEETRSCHVGVVYNPFQNRTTKVIVDGEHLIAFSKLKAIVPFELKSLHGYPLLMTIQNASMPFMSFELGESNKFVYGGFMGQLFEAMVQHVNFTPVISFVTPLVSTLRRFSNGTWTSALGAIDDERAEIAVGSVVINYERYQSFNFLYPISISPLILVFHKASTIPKWLNIYLPFLTETWLMIVAVFIAFDLTLMCVRRTNCYSLDCVKNTLLFFSTLLQISVSEPTTFSGRYIFYLWVYFSLIISSLYQGSLLSYLTVPRYYPQIKTFADAVDARVKIVSNTVLLERFRTSDNPSLRALYQNAFPPKSYAEAIHKFQTNTKAAYITGRGLLPYIFSIYGSSAECNDAYVSDESLGLTLISFCVAKTFPYIDRMNSVVMRSIEGGLITKWYNNVLREVGKNSFKLPCTSLSGNIVLTLDHLFSCFVILVIGLMIATSIFLLEICFAKYRGSKH